MTTYSSMAASSERETKIEHRRCYGCPYMQKWCSNTVLRDDKGLFCAAKSVGSRDSYIVVFDFFFFFIEVVFNFVSRGANLLAHRLHNLAFLFCQGSGG